MLSTYQILRHSCDLSGTYRTTREPSRDCKFAKSSRFLQKKPGQALFARVSPTSHAYSGFKNYEMLVSMPNLPIIHIKKQIQADIEFYEDSHGSVRHSIFGFCQDRCFFLGKHRHWMVNVLENTSLETRWFHFWKQNTQAGTTFSNVTWQHPTKPCVHSPPRVIGHTTHQQQEKSRPFIPKYGP